MRAALAALALIAGGLPLRAHGPITTKITWSKEVSRILYKRCAGCHRDGGAAPMALITYQQARPWAKAIKEEVLERRMPPWGAVKGFGEFRDEPALTQEEIGIVADWVEGGAPEGDSRYLPRVPALTESSVPGRAPQGRILSGVIQLDAPAILHGLRPVAVPEKASVQIVARHPDGRVEPVLWLRNYKTAWKRTFRLRKPLALAKGARLEATPARIARIALVTSVPSPAR